MKTTITYNISKITLENAVRVCIFRGISPTKIKNVKSIICETVRENGLAAIRFPEHWSTNDDEIAFYPQSKIDEIVDSLYGRIK